MKRLLNTASATPASYLVWALLIAVLTLGAGCKDEGKSGDGPNGQGEGPGQGQGGGPGGPGEGGDMPWPPPGGKKSDVPPGVTEVMNKMMNAFNEKDAKKVAGFFVSREAFLHVSDCNPADVVDRVMDGAKQAAQRATREGAGARFEGWKDGYIFELKKGDKPAECRAKEPVGLFMARFDWNIGGRKELGEAHFLRINGVWFFAKL